MGDTLVNLWTPGSDNTGSGVLCFNLQDIPIPQGVALLAECSITGLLWG